MRIVFTDHALAQLQERKIGKREVSDAIKNPTKVITQHPRRYRIFIIIKRGRKQYLLVIICEKEHSNIYVVTVFLTSKIKKYL